MKLKSKISIIVTVILLGTFLVYRYYLVPKSLDPQLNIFTVTKGTFTDYLEKTGRMRAQKRQIIYAFASGDLNKIAIHLGDQLSQGQKFAVINSDFNRGLFAPINGIISQVFRDSPGPILRGEPIIEISDLSQLELVVEVLTEEADLIKPGMSASITRNDHVAEGMVQSINKAGYKKISPLGVEEYRTEVIILPNSAGNLARDLDAGHNFEAQVTIILDRQTDVISIPINALKKHNLSWFVTLVAPDNSLSEREVKVKKFGPDMVWIESGLTENEKIAF